MMISFLKYILIFTLSIFGSLACSEPIVVLEYRGQGFQNNTHTPSDNAFVIDPDHTDQHVVLKGQSLGHIINEFYAGSGLDKRFLKLAIVAANPKAFAQENPNFMFAGAKLHLPSLNQIQAMILGTPINKSVQHNSQSPDRGIFFFGG
ncbi:MAG: pilus assembly protein FimV [Pseudomonadota bacterium]|nr:pilus assembly protein FimV [Pseudomonadota bacterium]